MKKIHSEIIRYSNRKLYDTFLRTYVTLAELRFRVQHGETFTVKDNASRKDITAYVLGQIIARNVFPKEALFRLIENGGY